MITKEVLSNFREDFKQAIKELEEKYNFEISLTKISYSDNDFTGTMKVVEKAGGKSGQQIEFEKYCRLYDLKESDYRRPVQSLTRGKSFVLVGFSPRAKKYPYLVECVETGDVYKSPSIDFI